jgi:hypothetical protein
MDIYLMIAILICAFIAQARKHWNWFTFFLVLNFLLVIRYFVVHPLPL